MTTAPAVPLNLRRAAAVVAVQAVALLAVSLVYLVRVLVGSPGDRATAAAGALLGVAAAALLGLLARGLAHTRRAALTPVVLAELLALPVAVFSFGGAGQWIPALCVGIPALAVLVLLFGDAASRNAFR